MSVSDTNFQRKLGWQFGLGFLLLLLLIAYFIFDFLFLFPKAPKPFPVWRPTKLSKQIRARMGISQNPEISGSI